MTNDFGKYLREKREEKGFTVNQLSLYSGISAAQLSRIENGKRGVPKAENIKKLSDALSIPYKEMMKVAGYLEDEGEIDTESNEFPELTEKDERDIAKRMEKLKKDLKEGAAGDGLSFMGDPLSDEAIESLLDALEYAERQATRINKKYIPKKHRNKSTEE
jgi:transcriptional regulator with XRE-family HTH domain